MFSFLHYVSIQHKVKFVHGTLNWEGKPSTIGGIGSVNCLVVQVIKLFTESLTIF